MPRTGDYDAATMALAKRYQSEGLSDAPQYCDGILGQMQTIELAKAAGAKVKIYADSAKGGLVYPKALA